MYKAQNKLPKKVKDFKNLGIKAKLLVVLIHFAKIANNSLITFNEKRFTAYYKLEMS